MKHIAAPLALVVSWFFLSPLAAHAQSAPATQKSSGVIAQKSRLMAQVYEDCRVEANRQKLHLLKRRQFLKQCRTKR